MIILKDLTKNYGKLVAVCNLNLKVEQGEIFGFIGPNGAGKTTTIRMMGGILKPTAGFITINGISMTECPVKAKRSIGFIPDRPFLYEKLSGLEFMSFTADLYGVDGDVEGRSLDMLAKFSLENRCHELIESYSHGMKQRLIIAAALLHDPPVIIVDEPMVGLDPAAAKMVKDIFRAEAARGKTIFMSTHTLSVAEELCDRIGVIHRGSLIALGTLGDLKRSAHVSEGDLEDVFIKLTDEDPL